jgi:hypothetical protein
MSILISLALSLINIATCSYVFDFQSLYTLDINFKKNADFYSDKTDTFFSEYFKSQSSSYLIENDDGDYLEMLCKIPLDLYSTSPEGK